MARKNGTTIDVQDLVTYLKGDKGDRGERGDDGIDGLDGTHGVSIEGPQGPPGKDGRDGRDGQNGQHGRDGQNSVGPTADEIKAMIAEAMATQEASEPVESTSTVSNISWEGNWDKARSYSKGNMVYRWGSSYIALKDVPAGTYPGNRENAASWDMMVKGGAGGGSSSSGSGSSLTVKDEGTQVATDVATLNFIGSNVTATDAGSHQVNITVTGGSGIAVQDEGIAVNTATTLNYVGAGVTATNAGAGVATVTIPGYTDEQSQDAVGGILTDTATIDFTYNDGANTITADIKPASVDLTSMVTGILPTPNGGTGIASPTAHKLLVGNGASAMTQLAVGSSGQLLLGVTTADPQFATMSGDATITNAGALTIANNAITTVKITDANVTYAKIANGTGLSVLGRATNSAGVNADIVGTANQVLRVNSGGTAVAFGAIDISTASVTGILGSANGGTANGFTKFSGPTTSEKTFTLPNASATILTDNAAVTVAQGGTGLGTLTAHAVLLGEGTSNVAFATIGTSGRLLIDQGAGADPSFNAMSGDATITNTGALTIANNAITTVKITDANVTYAKIANGTGLSVIGRSASSAGVNADIVGTADQVLRVNSGGTAVGFGTIATAGIAANAVTYAKIAQGTGLSVVGVTGSATANNADIVGTANQVLRVNSGGTGLAFGAIDVSTASVTGILGSANGGTANGFTKFSGPTTSEKTFTLPNASATILTDNATVTVAQGGTGAGTFTAHGIMLGEGTSALVPTAAMTDGQLLVGQTSADPLPKTISGDATLSAAGALTIANNAVSNAKFRQGIANSLVGVSGNATANVADIQATSAGQVMRMNTGGTTIGFGAISLSSANAVSNTLGVGNGGTGVANPTIHALYVGNGSSAMSAVAVGATNTVLHGNTGADPTFSAVSLSADVTGTLPVTNITNGAVITTFTPALSFATPGSSSFAYTTQLGTYVAIGNILLVSYQISATFTIGTASGNLLVSVPVNSGATGVTLLGQLSTTMPLHNALDTYSVMAIGASAATAQFRSGRNGTQAANIVAADLTTATAYTITGTLAYMI